MEKLDLEGMTLDALWALHEQISSILSKRILAEKRELEKRLMQLNGGKDRRASIALELISIEADHAGSRRKYPRVLPKYQNPEVPAETWSGRGRRPRWLVSALKTGGGIDDFRIEKAGQTKSSILHRRGSPSRQTDVGSDLSSEQIDQ